MNDNNFFATNLLYLRKKKKYTQAELARQLGKGESTIGCWENGIRQPTVADTIQVCKYFNLDIVDLISTDLNTDSTNENEKELLRLYRRLTPDQQNAIIKTMETMVK